LNQFILACCLLSILILSFLLLLRKRNLDFAAPNLLYEKLLRKPLGDVSQVERLIEAEKKQAPQASRAQLMERAVRRWERDLH
jgi:hypothetical protein